MRGYHHPLGWFRRRFGPSLRSNYGIDRPQVNHSMYAICAYIDPPNHPNRSVYMPVPWSVWVYLVYAIICRHRFWVVSSPIPRGPGWNSVDLTLFPFLGRPGSVAPPAGGRWSAMVRVGSVHGSSWIHQDPTGSNGIQQDPTAGFYDLRR